MSPRSTEQLFLEKDRCFLHNDRLPYLSNNFYNKIVSTMFSL